MTATTDPSILITLLKHKALHLLKGAYNKVIVPTSIIEEIPSSSLDKALTDGWLSLLDVDTDYFMRVDRIESRSGIRLSPHEESCVALALQYDAEPIVTNDREVDSLAKLLKISTDGIPSVIIQASRSGIISKEDGLKLFREIYRESLPGFGIEEQFRKSPRWPR
jgi:predicted nucleic acid-binding protein